MKYLKTFEQNKDKFDYSNQNLNELPKLPYSLQRLCCYNNNLTELPELPDSLQRLYCYNNNLTSLPELPDSLKYLNCYHNNLPFENLDGYKKWYKENESLIKERGISYAYKFYNKVNKYNIFD